MSKKWMASGYLKSQPSGDIDHEKGIIKGVSVCTSGEAKGHGVNLDSEFIREVTKQGSGLKQGLKARFGHPNMCSTALGTFIGRFKNFRTEGSQTLADLYLSNSAKETPHGNLFDYVLSLAEDESDMFGTSIVFTPGREYRKTKAGKKVYPPDYSESREEREKQREEWDAAEPEYFVECETLHACDAVDEPAANDGGLFSAWAQETVAGQLTEFLDINPEIWGVLKSNPSIVEALASYGDNMDEFITRYRAYRAQNGDTNMPNDKTNADAMEESTATGTEEAESVETNTEETATAESEVEDTAEETAESDTTEETETEAMSREEFKQIKDEFGAEIAADTFANGGNYQTALKAAYDKTKAENEVLSASDGGTPATVATAKNEKGCLFNTGK